MVGYRVDNERFVVLPRQLAGAVGAPPLSTLKKVEKQIRTGKTPACACSATSAAVKAER
jgi:hypothetical protein